MEAPARVENARVMPELSRFYGIVIRMYHNDHAPPHFHAWYAGEEAVLAIASLQVMHGYLPPRALRLVREWAGLHHDALAHAWATAQSGADPDPIDPLV